MGWVRISDGDTRNVIRTSVWKRLGTSWKTDKGTGRGWNGLKFVSSGGAKAAFCTASGWTAQD